MAFFAIVLVVFSALLHAGWNILGKSNTSSGTAFTLAAGVTASLLLTPYLIWYLNTIGWQSLPDSFWWIVLMSGACQMLYLVGLMLAYQQADIGVIYPIARALPVLMVGFGGSLLGHTLSWMQWSGFVMITLGCLVVPLARFRDCHVRSYVNLGVFWALVAAIGTTGYSILDKQALDIATQVVRVVLSDKHTAIFYLGVQFWAMVLFTLGWCVVSGNVGQIRHAWHIKQRAGLAGIMMASTYGLVLFAMTMTANVSLVVALRQISIVFGLIMGVLFLAERWFFTRGIGVSLILGGLLLALA
ncbi:EamA family transporter [Vibrio proteolyticus]